jgi:retron-type reverse transcriptase
MLSNGVKQGDSLSPTLFNIFVDDIKSSFIDNTQTKPVSLGVHTFNHLLYADDLVILSESPTGLQHCLNALDNYCEKWRLNINIKKTKVMILVYFVCCQ